MKIETTDEGAYKATEGCHTGHGDTHAMAVLDCLCNKQAKEIAEKIAPHIVHITPTCECEMGCR